MKAVIDQQGRIALDHDMQAQLGVQPGDEVLLQARGNELVITAANGKIGLGYEGNVLVHHGTCAPGLDAVADDREERMTQLSKGLSQ